MQTGRLSKRSCKTRKANTTRLSAAETWWATIREPGRIVDWTREHCASVVRGNHDKVVSGIDSLEWFNEVAQVAARWTMSQLSEEQLSYLHELPTGPG